MGLAALWHVGSFRPDIEPVSPALAGGKSQLFSQSRSGDIMTDRKIFHKLLYYLPPSECTGNSIRYSIVYITYLVPFQDLLNQEHRGITQATGYFKVWNQLYKYSSSGKTPCVSHSRQVTKRKDRFNLLMPITKPYMSEWTRFSAQTRKTGLPEKMQRYPKVDPYFRGKWSSPTDSRFLGVSGHCPDSPTPWEWNLWTHLWRSTVPEMKTLFTNGPWGGFLFSQKRRNETGKVNSAQVIFW